MVRFKNNYGAYISPNLLYLDYDRLKRVLYKEVGQQAAQRTDRSPGDSEEPSEFQRLLEQELSKVEGCFTERMIELEYALVDTQRLANEFVNLGDAEGVRKAAEDAALKRSTAMLYRRLLRLETYCLLNRTAATRIMKKRDKLLNASPNFRAYLKIVDKTRFGNGAKLFAVKTQIESLYASLFCKGVHEEALSKLHMTKTRANPSILLHATFKAGVVLALLLWLINDLIISPPLSLHYLTAADPSVYVYAAVGALVTYRWFWGFSVYMWDSADIDYILILDLDANKHMPSSAQIFSDAGNLSILYLVNVLIFHALRFNYRHSQNHDASWTSASGAIAYFSARAFVMPMLLVIGTLLHWLRSQFQPASFGVFSLKIIKNLVMSPFTAVHLRHTYAADILCSFVRVFSAMLFGACYFTSGSYLYASDPASAVGEERFATCQSDGMTAAKVVIFLIPYSIRFIQCLRQQRDDIIRQKQEKSVHVAHTRAAHAEVLNSPANPLKVGSSAKVDLRTTGGNSSATVGGTGVSIRSRRVQFSSPADSQNSSGRSVFEIQHMHSPTHTSEKIFHFVGDETDAMERGASYTRSNEEPSSRSHRQRHLESEAKETIVFHQPSAVRLGSTPSPLSHPELLDLPVPAILRMCFGKIAHIVPPCVIAWLDTLWMWPYSYNALRYFLNMCVIVFGAYPPQDPASDAYLSWYIPLYVVSTLYTCYWDVANDFQLLQFHSSRPLLRDKILYEDAQYFYYVVLVVNPILRFMWTLSFTPYGGHPFLVVFEIMRRSLWACIRMELGYIQELARRK